MGYKWKQAGSIRFWYSQRKVKGYHFSANPIACDAILELIPLLLEHPQAGPQTLIIDVVPEKGRHNKLNEAPALSKLKLDYQPELAGNFTIGPTTLSFSTPGLNQFQDSVRELKAGGGDWALWSCDSESESEPLWFWWW